MNRRDLIKYGIGAVVGVTATKALGNSTPEVLQPEILNYEEDKTPLIYSPGQYIWFQGWKYQTPRVDTTITLSTGHIPDYCLPEAEFIGIIKKVNLDGKEKLAIDWLKYSDNRTVLSWKRRTHSHILQKLYINKLSLSSFSYRWYTFDKSNHKYEYYAYDPYFVIRESTTSEVRGLLREEQRKC